MLQNCARWMALLIVFSPAVARAGIVPMAQLRQVAAGGSLSTVDETASFYEARLAENFGTFDDAVGLALRTEFGTATADGFTKQVSNIYTHEISVFGSADSFVFAPNPEDTAYASTVSQFSLRFQLTTPGQFQLSVSGFGSNAATSTMTLKNAADEELIGFDAAFTPAIDERLDLPAGEYSLAATVDSSGFFEFGSGEPDGRSEINVLFTQVPEPTSAVLYLLGSATAFVLRRRLARR